ncbi:MAG TPA: Rieske (2Fe-2S) protein [Angustibacter sp.]|nr:Rieske (2Fe-2S) protein [Angustibacter sp.]
MSTRMPRRRTVLHAGGALAVGGFTVSACGAGSTPQSAPTTVVTGPVGTPDQVPVGGGVIFPKAAVVVTQPVQGQFRAFSTRCPHQGCAVASVSDGFIVCPCHNSRFAVATGEPTPDSPAQQPLAPRQVAVESGSLVIEG